MASSLVRSLPRHRRRKPLPLNPALLHTPHRSRLRGLRAIRFLARNRMARSRPPSLPQAGPPCMDSYRPGSGPLRVARACLPTSRPATSISSEPDSAPCPVSSVPGPFVHAALPDLGDACGPRMGRASLVQRGGVSVTWRTIGEAHRLTPSS
jgi:hypothetical protein